MKLFSSVTLLTLALAGFGAAPVQTLQEQNELMFRQLKEVRGLSEGQLSAVRAILAKSGYAGQGNPALAKHPVTPEQCEAGLKQKGIHYENARFEKICGGKYMAPLYDPATQQPEDAKVCIDQFEFPDIPCAYPVVWIKAREAAEVCWVVGERLCDAHEWEGACAGSLQPPDYPVRSCEGLQSAAAVDTNANRCTTTRTATRAVELWTRVSEGDLRHVRLEDGRLRWRRLDGLRLEHVSSG